MASLILNIPYGGLQMPPMVQKRLALNTEELGWEHFRLTDPCLLKAVSEAAGGAVLKGFLGSKPIPERTLVAYRYSPLVSDPLGFLAASLSGGEPRSPEFIRTGSSGKDFQPWSPEERETVLKNSALPYLSEIKDKCLELLGSDTLVLLLTLRSFSSKPWNYEADRRYPRPQVSIGSGDEQKTPSGLASFIGRTFRTFGMWPELNWPHSGAWAPEGLQRLPRLFAANLSFRRDLFMDEAAGRLSPNYESFVRILRTIFTLLEEELETVVKIRWRRKHPPKPPSMVIKSGKNDSGRGERY